MGQPVVHFEVAGSDGERLREFYSQLFAWQIDADNPLRYGLVAREVAADGVGIGGGVTAAQPGTDPYVTFYVAVPAIDEALANAERLGGTRRWGPLRATETIELGQFCDPDGNLIGLFRSLI